MITPPDLTNIPRRGSSDGVTVYVSIGNSDDKLGQAEWARFVTDLNIVVSQHAREVYGLWYSTPYSQWQNMVTAFCLDITEVETVREKLAGLRLHYRQDSIAWVLVDRTEFL